MHRPTRYVEGFSESLWVSLAVKAVRIGWPEGLRQAQRRLCPSRMRSILTVQLFEDTFPTEAELPDAFAEVRALDYDALCQRNPHHGVPGLTLAENKLYNVLEMDPRWKYKQAARLIGEAKNRGFFLESRAYGDFHCWLLLMTENGKHRWPKIEPRQRTIDRTPWHGMPRAMADKHTAEGRGVETILSGSEHGHLAIARRVFTTEGWDDLRAEVHADLLPEPADKITTPRPKAAPRLPF